MCSGGSRCGSPVVRAITQQQGHTLRSSGVGSRAAGWRERRADHERTSNMMEPCSAMRAGCATPPWETAPARDQLLLQYNRRPINNHPHPPPSPSTLSDHASPLFSSRSTGLIYFEKLPTERHTVTKVMTPKVAVHPDRSSPGDSNDPDALRPCHLGKRMQPRHCDPAACHNLILGPPGG